MDSKKKLGISFWRDAYFDQAEAASRLSLDMMKPKSLVFDEASNVPCTAALEVNLQKLVSYFEKRARENERRAKREEAKLLTFHKLEEIAGVERSSYYFSGKADSYKRAAEKLKELLTRSEILS